MGNNVDHLDWRMKGVLEGVISSYGAMCDRSRQPGGYRTAQGTRECWRDTLPSKAERWAAKAAARATGPSGPVDCPCCGKSFLIPSVYDSVAECGLCELCAQFGDGLVSGVIAEREPTLEEAMAAPERGIRPAEARVIRQELRRRIEG